MEKEAVVKKMSKNRGARLNAVLVKNPWDGGVMTLRDFYRREEKEDEKDTSKLPENIPEGEQVFLNHIDYNGESYQMLLVTGNGYSNQSLYVRKQKNNAVFEIIAEKCHIPQEYLLEVASAFAKRGVAGARYSLGV